MLKSSRFFGIIPQHTRFFSVSSRRKAHLKDVFIVEAARTPMGSFRSQLATVTAPQLAAVAIRAILQRSGVAASEVQEVFLGQVCQANVGQAPARQAALQAGLDVSTVVTTVNKVVIGGGMESMSQVPYYMPRGDTPYGGIQLIDGITKDGLTDAFDNLIMGLCGEKTASDLGISREDQDAYAIQSYTRSAQAWQTGLIGPEIVPVNVKTRKGVSIVDKDEEFTRVDFDKLKALKTVFKKDGTITAGNASTLNDGAAAVLLLSEEALKKSNAKPLARIVAYGDAATNPLDFSIAPTLLVPKLLARTGLKIDDFAQIEVNEAFSVVALAFEGIFLVSGVRTPIGAFRGCLSSQTAVQLGTAAAVATIQRAGIIGSSIDETIAGCVLTANAGQNVARQIAMKAGVPDTIPAFTVNKVCSSSLKAVELAFNSIRADPTKSRILVVGTESMSNAPFYLPRGDVPYGGTPLIDGIVKDGLEDAQLKQSMGLCAEKSVKRDGITRKESDEYAIESYKRVAEAWNRGIFYDEVIPVKVKQQRGLEVSVAEDEGYEKLQEDKVPTLLPVFLKDGTGTITAANASSLNDGAAAGIVCSGAAIDKEKLPLCELIDFAETAGPPEYFTEAPFYAVKQLLLKQNLEVEDIALWEINEAFSCTALIFMKELRLDRSIVNVKGGAVALGHPLGMSGLRILISLAYSLKPGELGIAAICNGGGEAVAVLIKGMNSPCPHDDD